MKRLLLPLFLLLPLLSACGGSDDTEKPGRPLPSDRQREEDRGKLDGEGWTVLGGDDSAKSSGGGASPIGVNSFLWRATLDTLSFMPIQTADPFGGTILTDWYEDPKTPGERFKVNALILDRSLRTDGVRISLFRQVKDKKGNWSDASVDPSAATKIEDTILTRARELRLAQQAK